MNPHVSFLRKPKSSMIPGIIFVLGCSVLHFFFVCLNCSSSYMSTSVAYCRCLPHFCCCRQVFLPSGGNIVSLMRTACTGSFAFVPVAGCGANSIVAIQCAGPLGTHFRSRFSCAATLGVDFVGALAPPCLVFFPPSLIR